MRLLPPALVSIFRNMHLKAKLRILKNKTTDERREEKTSTTQLKIISRGIN